jgi:thioesterase domain-containing protein
MIYLGVMTRHRQNTGPRLDREVDARLEKLFRLTKIKHGDFDGRAYDELAALPPHAAVRAIDRFQSKVSDDVRNLSAFFTSIIRQVREGDHVTLRPWFQMHVSVSPSPSIALKLMLHVLTHVKCRNMNRRLH